LTVFFLCFFFFSPFLSHLKKYLTSPCVNKFIYLFSVLQRQHEREEQEREDSARRERRRERAVREQAAAAAKEEERRRRAPPPRIRVAGSPLRHTPPGAFSSMYSRGGLSPASTGRHRSPSARREDDASSVCAKDFIKKKKKKKNAAHTR
jgi:hypothetical protein